MHRIIKRLSVTIVLLALLLMPTVAFAAGNGGCPTRDYSSLYAAGMTPCNSISNSSGYNYAGGSYCTTGSCNSAKSGDTCTTGSCNSAKSGDTCTTGSCNSAKSDDTCTTGSCNSAKSGDTCTTGSCDSAKSGDTCTTGSCDSAKSGDTCTTGSCNSAKSGNSVSAKANYNSFFYNLFSRYFNYGDSTTAKTTTANTSVFKQAAARPTTGETTTVSGTISEQYASEVLRLVNIERAEEGLSALAMDDTLVAGAKIRVQEITASFSHTRPDGTSCFTALKEVGATYTSAGENIAIGQRTPAEVVEAWMNSPGHRANIMSTKYTRIGIAVTESTGQYAGYAWAQFFAN